MQFGGHCAVVRLVRSMGLVGLSLWRWRIARRRRNSSSWSLVGLSSLFRWWITRQRHQKEATIAPMCQQYLDFSNHPALSYTIILHSIQPYHEVQTKQVYSSSYTGLFSHPTLSYPIIHILHEWREAPLDCMAERRKA